MKLGWLSDIHLNFLREEPLSAFLDLLASSPVDAWLISGDISDAPDIVKHLRQLATRLNTPIFFVIGNHDFYHGSIARVRSEIKELVSGVENLHWLTSSGPQTLQDDLIVVGDDSWADARFGDPEGSEVELNDFYQIRELSSLTKPARIDACRELADESTMRIRPKLELASSTVSQVIILTHAPPFRGATWHEGKISGDAWLPWFSCKVMGEVILGCALKHPDCQFTVLCGHTHGGGKYRTSSNVLVHTAEAEYGAPRIQEIFEFE